MTHEFIPIDTRNSQVEKSHSLFGEKVRGFLANNEQSQQLRNDVFRLATEGVWAKLNAMNPSFDSIINDTGKPLVFTGQQPTIDYGVYRRISKRAGVHDDLITIHTHADHDRAGKEGFSTIKLPVIRDGILEYKSYKVGPEHGDEDLMSQIRSPRVDEVEEFFGQIISDSDATGPTSSDPSVINECKNFIIENIADIRSLAEFNGVVQTFLVRKLCPEINTIDFMLSDLLETSSVRTALAEIVLDMPNWIAGYNNAATHVNSIPQPDGHLLPQPLRQLENQNSILFIGNVQKLFELPLWIISDGQRQRGWLVLGVNGSEIGTYDAKSEVFKTEIKFNEITTVQKLLDNPRFAKISPGAVVLVDILRHKLKLPVIHGKTGHFYEAINELSKVQLNDSGDTLPKDLLANPDTLGSMAPIASTSLQARATVEERIHFNASIQNLLNQKADMEEARSSTNRNLGESFKEMSRAMQTVLNRPDIQLDKNSSIRGLEEGHPLNGIAQELDCLEDYFKENPDLGVQINRTRKPLVAIENLYDVYRTLGSERFLGILTEKNLVISQHLWSVLHDWVELNNEKVILNLHKVSVEEQIAEINKKIEKLRKDKKKDAPLLQAAMYKPDLVRKIYNITSTSAKRVGPKNERYGDIYNSPQEK